MASVEGGFAHEHMDEFLVVGIDVGRETSFANDPVLRAPTVIYGNVKVGLNFDGAHFIFIREHTVIGDDVYVGPITQIGHHVKIGDRVRIRGQAFIPEYCVIGDDAWIGPGVIMMNVPHPKCEYAKPCSKELAVKIGDGAIIGAGAMLMPGVTIGKNAFIGAGALVRGNIPDEAVYYGHPAQNHKNIGDLGCWFGKVDGSEKLGMEEEEANDYRPY